MAYREVDVLEVKEILRRWLSGAEKKQIARAMGVDTRTVRRYLAWAVEAGLDRPSREASEAVNVDDEALERLVTEIAQRRRRDRGRPRGASWEICEQHKEDIRQLLEQKHLGRPLTLKKAWKLLRRKRVVIPYPTLRRFARSELGYRSSSSPMPVADGEPGKELQVDTGWVCVVGPDEQGKTRRVKAWIFTAVVSRHRFVYPCYRETTAQAIEACEAAWQFYGGVFEVLIPDNTKAIVDLADSLDPKLVRTFLEYSQARGFYVDPARVRTPTDKPRVERSVQHVRQDCYAGEKLLDVPAAREHGARWCREDYGLGVHGQTRRRPLEHFEEAERPALKPCPTTPYDVPAWGCARVGRDQHAQVAYALYSLPEQYRGKRLKTRADSQTVRLYLGDELVKMHPRVPAGQRRSDPADFPPERFATAQRDADYFRGKAREQGEWIGKYADALLESKLPWMRMRQVHALLRLPERYGAERVEVACKDALELELVNVVRLEKVIQLGRPSESASIEKPPAGRVIPFPRFLRPTSSYALQRGAQPEPPTKEDRA